jgi:integrase
MSCVNEIPFEPICCCSSSFRDCAERMPQLSNAVKFHLTSEKYFVPKGGEDRAYDLPLSDLLKEIIRRRMTDNSTLYGNSCEWIFPTLDRRGRVGHVTEPKEEGRPLPHRLRDTYATAAHEAHVPAPDQKILMNHMLPEGADVTDDYKRPSWDYLVKEQQRITDYLRQKALSSVDAVTVSSKPI